VETWLDQLAIITIGSPVTADLTPGPPPRWESTNELRDQRIPQKIPDEIQALVDSFREGVPVVVIMSRDCRLVPLPLAPQYAYSYLGFFRLTGLHVGASQIYMHMLIFLMCLEREDCGVGVCWRFCGRSSTMEI
jgi:hypothetical protein